MINRSRDFRYATPDIIKKYQTQYESLRWSVAEPCLTAERRQHKCYIQVKEMIARTTRVLEHTIHTWEYFWLRITFGTCFKSVLILFPAFFPLGNSVVLVLRQAGIIIFCAYKLPFLSSSLAPQHLPWTEACLFRAKSCPSHSYGRPEMAFKIWFNF